MSFYAYVFHLCNKIKLIKGLRIMYLRNSQRLFTLLLNMKKLFSCSFSKYVLNVHIVPFFTIFRATLNWIISISNTYQRFNGNCMFLYLFYMLQLFSFYYWLISHIWFMYMLHTTCYAHAFRNLMCSLHVMQNFFNQLD